MVNLLRKYQQSLMILITLLVIVAFIWLYNTTQFEKIGHDRLATIYDRALTKADVERFQREFYVAADLGLTNYIQVLGGMEQGGFEDFIFNRIVAQHEAKDLEVDASGDEIYSTLKSLPRFQTNGQFDPSKYADFIQRALTPRGFNEKQLENLVRDSITVDKLKDLIAATAAPSEADFRNAYEQQYRKTQVQVVKFRTADFRNGIEISEDDLKKAYDQRKDSLKTEEKRQIDYVKFALSEAANKQLSGADRTKALQTLADSAQEFSQEMLNKDAKFEDVAAKHKLEVKKTEPFTSSTPPDDLKNPAVVKAAFALSQADPNSDAIQDEDGFYLLRLVKVEEPRPLTYEEAKPELAAQLKEERATEQLNTKGAEVRNKIADLVKDGKSFEQAATELGLKVEKPEPFSPAEPPKGDVSRDVVMKATELSPGQVSEFTPSEDGGFIAFVEKRLPVDEKKYAEDKSRMGERYSAGRGILLFREWLRTAREKANVQVTSAGRA